MSAELSQITAAFSTLRTTARILAPVASKATNNNKGKVCKRNFALQKEKGRCVYNSTFSASAMDLFIPKF